MQTLTSLEVHMEPHEVNFNFEGLEPPKMLLADHPYFVTSTSKLR